MHWLKAWIFGLFISPAGNLQEQYSYLYFLRNTGAKASEYSFSIFVNDSLFCKLNEKRFSGHVLNPGMKIIHGQYGGSDPKGKPERINILMEPGGVYYVKLQLHQRFGGCDLVCTEINPAEARTLLKDLKADAKCK